ncbi:TPA: hypothetical protein DHW58_01265 [Patescibacteria group bacterium]|uniref:Carboxyl-terminal protease n=2 Tax=Bacteria division Kazan-3B-28 TaxID=1798534 RepID=A0A0G2A3U4_UNCK3|nr:MAG: Carboxyl-terminal protease [candidate division Kazan bacterium GW2011_GWA1_50_15]KKW25579.1 MAG: Carboxyl-terminal protease [candidate division Kazan bacterium GW2011_GWC1_52_13]KKW26884.1 MAG: Carboxyl-terminal protease [candidate division Kazan bacterium GW2011_GWB1_52_7]HCL47600.1 hypothetical protein [Patescibacteria group bacterium]HCR42712.1 hypothetical protein [Patescibacteria group bacterium]
MGKQVGLYAAGVVLLLAVYFLGMTYGYYGRVNLQNYSAVFKQELMGSRLGQTDLDLLWTVTDLVDAKYIGRPNYQDMLYGAIRGAVTALGDPYTVFTSPTENQEFFAALDGIYDGIGVEIDVVGGHLLVISPLKDSPADKAGLLPRDEVLAIDGESVTGLTLGEVVAKMKGPAGTVVRLTVGRVGINEPLDIEIQRETVRKRSVEVTVDDNKIAVVGILRFASDTETTFRAAVNEVLAKGAVGMVLDMRNNPGGFLDVGVKVANEFLASGQIVEERFKDGKVTPFSADGSGRLTKLPVVVLVNGGSASAAEIVAGALQDNQRAKIAGEQTFGKGSVQEVEAFPDGSALRLTVAKWYTPKGRSISDEGIRPDKVIEWRSDSTIDNQLDGAKQVLQTLIGR